MRTRNLLACGCAAALVMPAVQADGSDSTLRLSSLLPGRRLERVTYSPAHLERVWLVLGEYRVALIGRENLEGQVKVRAPEQALELVRVFTTPHSWQLSRVEAMVEVRPGPRADPYYFVVPEAQFRSCCVPAVATVAPESTPKYMWFVVQRTVVEKDYSVYAITEVVGEDGRIVTTEKKLIDKMGQKLGLFPTP